jgi:tRNA(fMet)-specific endonuclease VapC
MRLIADSTVLIDLWRLRREPRRLGQLRAHLDGNDAYIPWQVVFEFARGAYRRGVTDAAIRRFLSPFTILPVTEGQVWQAAHIDADLSLAGRSIGSADVWIAAAARETVLPVLTANAAHFRQVSGLTVLDYEILP